MAKSLFEKLGLVESEPIQPVSYDIEDISFDDTSEEKIETTDFNEELIYPDEIYKNAKYENENSIYKIQEFKEALPKTMSTEMMKQSVLGILKPTNLDVNDLIEDGNARINILNQNIAALNDEKNDYVSILSKEIAELQAKIEKNKVDINNKEVFSAKQLSVIEDEINKINNIINFISSPTEGE
jgi:hypothetical protein